MNWRVALLLAIAGAAMAGVFAVPPIRQDLAYHAFVVAGAWAFGFDSRPRLQPNRQNL
ncbi:MAG: hypothetical protein ACREK6_08140 [Candidatus Rokuibacteriota bacterium]